MPRRSIPGVPNSRVSIFLQRICSAARKKVEGGGGGGGRETLHFLCNNGFRVGMLEVNNSALSPFLDTLNTRGRVDISIYIYICIYIGG